MARSTAQREPAAFCAGKFRFANFNAAAKAARRTMRSKSRDGAYNAYHCRACQGFHVGSDALGRPKRPVRELEVIDE